MTVVMKSLWRICSVTSSNRYWSEAVLTFERKYRCNNLRMVILQKADFHSYFMNLIRYSKKLMGPHGQHSMSNKKDFLNQFINDGVLRSQTKENTIESNTGGIFSFCGVRRKWASVCSGELDMQMND